MRTRWTAIVLHQVKFETKTISAIRAWRAAHSTRNTEVLLEIHDRDSNNNPVAAFLKLSASPAPRVYLSGVGSPQHSSEHECQEFMLVLRI